MTDRRRGAHRWARVAYLALLAFALLSPFEVRLDLAFAAGRLLGALDLSLSPADVVDGVRNLVLFAGWGLLWVTTGRTDAPYRRRILEALGTGVAVSVTAEAVQAFLPGRFPSLLDVVTNGLGAWGGAVAGLAAVRVLEVRREQPGLLGVPAYAVAAPYLAAVLAEAAFPLLRHVGPPGSHGGPLRRAAWSLEQLSWESLTVLPATDVLLFLPAGVMLVLALREIGVPRGKAVGWTAAAGAAVAVVGELVHAPLGRTIEVGPLLVHAAAVAGGGWLGVALLPDVGRAAPADSEPDRTGSEGTEPGRTGPADDERGRRRILQFLAGYGLLLFLWNARPFVPETDPGAMLSALSPGRWLPLEALGGRRDLYTVSDIFRNFLLFLPVGAVLAVRPLQRSGPLRALGPAVILAVGVELVQVLVAVRFFDLTDALVSLAGAGVAWCLVREAGLTRRKPLME